MGKKIADSQDKVSESKPTNTKSLPNAWLVTYQYTYHYWNGAAGQGYNQPNIATTVVREHPAIWLDKRQTAFEEKQAEMRTSEKPIGNAYRIDHVIFYGECPDNEYENF